MRAILRNGYGWIGKSQRALKPAVTSRGGQRCISSSKATLSSRWIMESHFEGMPKVSDFKLAKETKGDEAALKSGEIRTEALFWSVDPYMRIYPRAFGFPVPMTMIGSQVAKVLDSEHSGYRPGDLVVSYLGWQDRVVFNPDEMQSTQGKGPAALPKVRPAISLPEGLSPSHLLGVLGMPGNTAYFGLTELCRPKAGDTVVVSGAGGAVGALVGQIAKVKGCRAIGITGSDEKCAWLKEELGFDEAINYKRGNLRPSLKRAAPNGIDCYFDNVGGKISWSVMSLMNMYGRVAVCGSISSYNDTAENQTLDPPMQPLLVMNQLCVEGFFVWRWLDRWEEGLIQMRDWTLEGKIKPEETVVQGFENLPQALIQMLEGANRGKMVVKA